MAANDVYDHIVALKSFLASLPNKGIDVARHKAEVLDKVKALPAISLHDATRIANQLHGLFEQPEDEVFTWLQSKVSTGATTGAPVPGRNKPLQDWQSFPMFLFQSHWDHIMDDGVPRRGD